MGTFGPAYDEAVDGSAVRAQMQRIYHLMADGAWRTLGEIAQVTGDPEASVSAQLRHLRKPRFGAHVVEKRRRGALRAWEYRVSSSDLFSSAAVAAVPRTSRGDAR